jgi:hypothetical protein
MTIEISMLHVEISSKVVKNDVMCHFYVNCHVNITIDVSTIKSQITLTNCYDGMLHVCFASLHGTITQAKEHDL